MECLLQAPGYLGPSLALAKMIWNRWDSIRFFFLLRVEESLESELKEQKLVNIARK